MGKLKFGEKIRPLQPLERAAASKKFCHECMALPTHIGEHYVISTFHDDPDYSPITYLFCERHADEFSKNSEDFNNGPEAA